MHLATLLPIAPILLLPFIIVFFVVVFPFWLVGVAVTWTIKSVDRLIRGPTPPGTSRRTERWFRWVLTFGGFTDR